MPQRYEKTSILARFILIFYIFTLIFLGLRSLDKAKHDEYVPNDVTSPGNWVPALDDPEGLESNKGMTHSVIPCVINVIMMQHRFLVFFFCAMNDEALLSAPSMTAKSL